MRGSGRSSAFAPKNPIGSRSRGSAGSRSQSRRTSVHRPASTSESRTVGLLGRRAVIATRIVHIGKESNELEVVEAGAVHDVDEVLTEYQSPQRDPWAALVRPTLQEFGARVVAERSGLSLSAVKDQ